MSKKLKMRLLAGMAAASTISAPAFADLPASVSTAITNAGADTVSAQTLIIGVVVGVWALKKVGNLFGR